MSLFLLVLAVKISLLFFSSIILSHLKEQLPFVNRLFIMIVVVYYYQFCSLRTTRENNFYSNWCHPLKIKVIIMLVLMTILETFAKIRTILSQWLSK